MNCYNGEKYLRAAIDSIVGQTYQNWELIFWDNQSTDSTATICASYLDDRIRYFYAPEHTELGQARILAFAQARGDFIAILDADDVSNADRLSRQVQYFADHPEVGLLGTWGHHIDRDGCVFAEFRPPADQNELQNCLGWTNPILHSSTMYRRQLAIQIHGYDSSLVNSSDYGLILAMAQVSRIAVLGEFLCGLRVLPSSMSRSKKYRSIVAREELRLYQRAAVCLPLSEFARRLNRRAQAIERIKLGLCRLSEGSPMTGLISILKELAKEPSALWGNGPIRRFLNITWWS